MYVYMLFPLLVSVPVLRDKDFFSWPWWLMSLIPALVSEVGTGEWGVQGVSLYILFQKVNKRADER